MISQEYPLAEACNLSQNQIALKAEEYAKKVGYVLGSDIEPVLKRQGGRIEYQSMPDWETTHSGSIIVNSPNDFVIFLSNFTGPLRDRFTIAHELGHYVLHSDEGKKKLKAKRFGATLVEREANWFAASFLMPEGAFLEQLAKNNDPKYLAAHFLVSLTAVNIRKEHFAKRNV